MSSEDDKASGEQTNINTEGGDAAGRDIDKRQGEVFVEGNLVNQPGWNVGGNVYNVAGDYYQAPTTQLSLQQQRNRRVMLQKVKTIWIDGLLEQSLPKELRIALDLTTKPDAIDLPLNALVQELNQPARPLPAGTPIIDVFDQMSGALLILGAPGAGKTTLLLELARDLIARAEQDEGHPIPVVFNLSSWAEKRRPFREWLVEELNQRYDVPRKLAQAWMGADVVLPLLDGLDEVAAEHRSACVEAINTYRLQDAGVIVPLAVCSRVADYELLTTKLKLQGAVMVQPLAPPQVDTYLERAGERLAGVRAALRDDAVLGKILDTPLMLSIVTLAYAEQSAAALQALGTIDDRRRHLFDAYITSVVARRRKETRYNREQLVDWLAWLAAQMVRHSQIVYSIERMQPDWLPLVQRRGYRRRIQLFSGLLVSLVGGLAGGLAGGLIGHLAFGLLGGLYGGLCVGLDFGQRGDAEEIKCIERLNWSWPRNLGVLLLLGGVFAGLVLGLFVELLAELNNGFAVDLLGDLGVEVGGGLGVGLFLGLFFGLSLVLSLVLAAGLSGNESELRTTPNQGIHHSARNVLVAMMVVGPLFGLLIGLAYGLLFGLVLGLSIGLLGGLLFGLSFGGRAVIQHYTLRWLLYRNGSLPFRLVPFLDYCVERIFLRKVGGGYIFVHRLLMEHFASLYDEDGKVRR